MKSSIRHTGIVVQDIEKSLTFWTKIMGFNILKKMDESGDYIDKITGLNKVKLETYKLIDKNGNIIELLKFLSHPGKKSWDGSSNSTGITHLALNVDSIEYFLRTFNNFGYINNVNPQISPDGKVKVVYVNGPEGIILELVENL